MKYRLVVSGIIVLALNLFMLQGCATIPGGGNVYEPSGQGPFPAVIVLHSIGGFSEHDKKFAQRLSSQGYVTMTVDYFAGDGNNAKHGYEYLKTLPNVNSERIGLVGFSMGVREALDLASRVAIMDSNQNISAIVSYYSTHLLGIWSKSLKHPPILFLHGDQDKGMTSLDIINYCKAQKVNGTICETHVYDGVKHAFDVRRSKYWGWNANATKDAWNRTLSFLEKYVKEGHK